MKRTFPLIITAVGGFVLIISFFIPVTQGWGEVTAVWFDVLASIAFLLGGGNLLKVHLKKVSDRAAGWGFSAVTVLAFVATLVVGLGKFGASPSANQEYFGETFASLPLAAFPESQVARSPGTIPGRADGKRLPKAVRGQLSEQDGQLVFRGWMLPNQKQDLLKYQDLLEWQCAVERLFEEAQPPEPLTDQVAYHADHSALGFQGVMNDDHRATLLAMSDRPVWTQAVQSLYQSSRRVTAVELDRLPEGVGIPESLVDRISFDAAEGQLRIQGPMPVSVRSALTGQFPRIKPLTDQQRDALLRGLERRGQPLSEAQMKSFDQALNGTWSVEQLTTVLNGAGEPQEVDKTACELLKEKNAGVEHLEPTKTSGTPTELSDEQRQAVIRFARDEIHERDELVAELKQLGDFAPRQSAALDTFFQSVPTTGRFSKGLCFALLRDGPLSDRQRQFLVGDAQTEFAWRKTVNQLFLAAHQPKYLWSGKYNEQGTPFWWLYEYVFKPLTATMFAMLAFYVASAAFRAFRAKNVEAILLLGTAFIILLGRTFAGVLLTDWLPESLAGLKIENLTVYIMSVFNTAGNRAIMIGIALGIASTSLKVLLGVDRSYLGQD